MGKSTIDTVLIIEDEAIIGMALSADLEDMGYTVVDIIAKGEDALQLLSNESIDLVLLDIKLGGSWDGLETLKRIREVATPRVVFISGNSELNTQVKVDGLAADGFLVKPVNLRELKDLLHAMQ